MPDRHDEQAVVPQYRYRGSVRPSAEVSRPVVAHRHAARAAANDAGGTGAVAAGTSATLDIFDVIDSYGGWWGISSTDVDRALAELGDVDTLYVRINSPGGEATEGVAIANLLRAHPADVRVTVYGMAASAASIIAVAGNTLSMAPGSTLMVHDASGFAYGDVVAMQAGLNMLNTISDSYASLYAFKAGGTAEQWRATMRDTTWYTPDAAVAAQLADRVGLDPSLPGGLPDVEDDADTDDATVIEIDIELNPAARAVTRRSDLTLLPAAAAAAPHAPAAPEPPRVTPPTNPEGADAMSDTLIQGLRERLGVTDESIDEDGLLAALDETLAEQTEPDATATTAAAEAAPTIPEGSVVVPRVQLEELQTAAAAGVEARTQQLTESRDREISAAIADGRIAPARREHWEQAYAADRDGASAALASLPAGLIPVKPTGYAGDAPEADPAAGDNYWFPGARVPAGQES